MKAAEESLKAQGAGKANLAWRSRRSTVQSDRSPGQRRAGNSPEEQPGQIKWEVM